jgi:hypothetical protein
MGRLLPRDRALSLRFGVADWVLWALSCAAAMAATAFFGGIAANFTGAAVAVGLGVVIARLGVPFLRWSSWSLGGWLLGNTLFGRFLSPAFGGLAYGGLDRLRAFVAREPASSSVARRTDNATVPGPE